MDRGKENIAKVMMNMEGDDSASQKKSSTSTGNASWFLPRSSRPFHHRQPFCCSNPDRNVCKPLPTKGLILIPSRSETLNIGATAREGGF